jgi:hypothetical protein
MRTLLACATIVLLLVAGSVEAAHTCDVAPADGQARVNAHPTLGTGALGCAICASAHGSPLASSAPGLSPDAVRPEPVPTLFSHAPHFLAGFALYIRPPPAG